MIWVKLCGLRSVRQVRAAAAVGADALGFNLVPSSRRRVDLVRLGTLLSEVPPGIERVAVLQNAPLEDVLRLLERFNLTTVQLHGEEDARYVARLRFCRPIKALGWQPTEALPDPRPIWDAGGRVLLDRRVGDSFGGTGRRVALRAAARLACEGPIILAGGLTPANLGQTLSAVRPHGVDTAGGIEVDGQPHGARMQLFVREARLWAH